MKFSLWIVVLCSVCVYGFVHYPIAIPTNEKYSVSFPAPYANYFTMVPCTGQFNTYLGLGYAPTTSKYNQTATYQVNPYFTLEVQNNSLDVNLLITCISQYQNICASLDLLLYNTSAEFYTFYPSPELGVRGTWWYLPLDMDSPHSLDTAYAYGMVNWTKTGNPLDNYTVYWQSEPTGSSSGFFFSACGVRSWMKVLTSDIGTVQDNGDGTMTAIFPSIRFGVTFFVGIVVDRTGGYSSSYDGFIMNIAYEGTSGPDIITTATGIATGTGGTVSGTSAQSSGPAASTSAACPPALPLLPFLSLLLLTALLFRPTLCQV